MSASRVLIVSYTFPPCGGIGGRRWAKFAKYLHRSGHPLIVLAARIKTAAKSPWEADVAGLDVRWWKSKYPSILNAYPRSRWAKLKYRLALSYIKRINPGNPYDRAFPDKGSYTALLRETIAAFQPSVVIISGGPFCLLHHAIPILREARVPGIADFRDPWSWGEPFGYKYLSGKRLQHELRAEAAVIDAFSRTITPSSKILEGLKKAYPSRADRLLRLPHAFDPEDIAPAETPASGGPLQLIYGGALYPDTEEHMGQLMEQVAQNPEHLHLRILSEKWQSITPAGANIESAPPLPAAEFYKAVARCHWLVLLIPAHVKDDILTKVYEYAATGVPILIMGRRGRLARWLEERGVGTWASSGAAAKELLLKGRPRNDTSWLSVYAYPTVTRQLASILAQTSS